MCIIGTPELEHKCFAQCPLCWSFTVSKMNAIARGQSVYLGTIEVIKDAANAGCSLCWLLIEGFGSRPEGGIFHIGANVSMTVEHPKSAGLPQVEQITFKMSNPIDFYQHFGYSRVFINELERREASFRVGLYSEGGDVAELVPRRAADPSVVSTEAYETANKWITDCLLNHSKCPDQRDSVGLPTRVLDVRSTADKVNLHLAKGEKKRYAALSYCWGTTPQITTTTDNISLFVHDGVEVESLPKTLQDAIFSTKQLGIPYLWIDSLCIIQNSPEDKSVEIAQMPDIYRNALVTISAAASKDCGHGFLADRQNLIHRIRGSLRLPLIEDSSAEASDNSKAISRGDFFLCFNSQLGFTANFSHEPINRRAWTLQEAWLSPRLLIYGSGPLQWQCLSETLTRGAETDVILGESDVEYLRDRDNFFAKNSIPFSFDTAGTQSTYVNPDCDNSSLLRDWERLLDHYCSRQLSVPMDKLPALSGIAAEFQRLSNDYYLAGLWRSSLPFSLLWHRSNRLAENQAAVSDSMQSKLPPSESCAVEPLYIAPSWSPLSTTGPIALKAEIPRLRSTFIFVHNATTIPSAPIAPLGSVVSGSIELTGLMCWIPWAVLIARFSIETKQEPHRFSDYIIPDGGNKNPHFVAAATEHEVSDTRQHRGPGYRFSDLRTTHARILPAQTPMKLPAALAPSIAHIDGKNGGILSRGSTQRCPGEFWFLEVQRSSTPAGLVLVELDNGNFQRTGFFYLGRNEAVEEEDDEEPWAGTTPMRGLRDWDWEAGLEMRRIKIV